MIHDPFLSDPQRYEKLLNENVEAYSREEPFPHCFMDDFLPIELANEIHGMFPSPDGADWHKFSDPTGLKLATKDIDQLNTELRNILSLFNSAPMLTFLEKLTGIAGLIPDPWFEGGGLHQIQSGGFLKIHADFNHHQRLNLDRRINLLLYLNPDWDESFGGHLELWDKEMTSAVERVLPIHNRCVVFNTTDDAFHGHPHPLTSPEGVTRKSIAIYYYTNGRPEEEKHAAHTTIYKQTPEEIAATQTTKHKLLTGCSKALDLAASVAYQPSKLLRYLSEKVRPRT